MRILYHHRTQAEDAQGVHIYEIIRCFRALGHEVEEVALVPAGDGPHTSTGEKTRGRGWGLLSRLVPNVVYELMELGYNVVGARRLRRAIRRFRPDFAYERYSLHTSCGVREARRAGIPLILEINAPLALEQERLGKLTFRRLAHRRERAIVSAASRVIVVSTPMKRIFVEAGVPEDKLVVIPNGVDPAHFDGGDDGGEVRRRHGLEGKRILGFVGWIRSWHGLTGLATAMAQWTGALEDVHLLVVGDGPARSDLETAAARAGVAHRVHVTGPVDRAGMPAHVAAFDLALQPAATPYASPMKIFEYLAMGKPVLACRQENLEEILEEGVDARFFEAGDPEDLARVARELLEDPAALERMSREARETIRRRGFLWLENARRAVELAREAGAGP